MRIRREIIKMNSELGSGLIEKENEPPTIGSISESITKSKADGITRWEQGGRAIKGDGTPVSCRMIKDFDTHGLES